MSLGTVIELKLHVDLHMTKINWCWVDMDYYGDAVGAVVDIEVTGRSTHDQDPTNWECWVDSK